MLYELLSQLAQGLTGPAEDAEIIDHGNIGGACGGAMIGIQKHCDGYRLPSPAAQFQWPLIRKIKFTF